MTPSNYKTYATWCISIYTPSTNGSFAAIIKQYLRPNGTQVDIRWVLPEALEPAYLAMLKHGVWLAVEILTTGELSITIEDYEADYDIEIVGIGCAIGDAISKLLARKSWIR